MAPTPSLTSNYTIILSGLSGAILGAATALISQFLAHHLAEQRERRRFQIQAFERFRKEFTEDEFLRGISVKKSQLTDDEIDDYLGFFEEVGLYFHRNLVDRELVDEILGDDIMNAWEDDGIRKAIGAVRVGEDDPSYFHYFEELARFCLKQREERKNGRRKKS